MIPPNLCHPFEIPIQRIFPINYANDLTLKRSTYANLLKLTFFDSILHMLQYNQQICWTIFKSLWSILHASMKSSFDRIMHTAQHRIWISSPFASFNIWCILRDWSFAGLHKPEFFNQNPLSFYNMMATTSQIWWDRHETKLNLKRSIQQSKN